MALIWRVGRLSAAYSRANLVTDKISHNNNNDTLIAGPESSNRISGFRNWTGMIPLLWGFVPLPPPHPAPWKGFSPVCHLVERAAARRAIFQSCRQLGGGKIAGLPTKAWNASGFWHHLQSVILWKSWAKLRRHGFREKPFPLALTKPANTS